MEIEKQNHREILHINANLRITGVPVLSASYLAEALCQENSVMRYYVPPEVMDDNEVIEMAWEKLLTYRNTDILVHGWVNLI